MTETEKSYLTRLSRAERTAFLKAHRKPPIPPSRSFDAKRAAHKKSERREAAMIRRRFPGE